MRTRVGQALGQWVGVPSQIVWWWPAVSAPDYIQPVELRPPFPFPGQVPVSAVRAPDYNVPVTIKNGFAIAGAAEGWVRPPLADELEAGPAYNPDRLLGLDEWMP